MVFKFVGGNIPSSTSYQLWTSSKTVSENVIAALDTTSTHRGHYKNRIVQNWQAFNPREVSGCEFWVKTAFILLRKCLTFQASPEVIIQTPLKYWSV